MKPFELSQAHPFSKLACLVIVLAGIAICSRASGIGFIAGTDFSDVTYFQSLGVVYKDGGQVQSEPLEILKKRGLTCIRLRLWTSSAAQAESDPYDCINNLDYTVPLAVRVKNLGFQFLLDFHYSDYWTQPNLQDKPAAWAGLTFNQLVQKMHDYSSNCISVFAAAGAMPDYVQVGNEINNGLLWPDGQVPGTNAAVQWPHLAQLLTAAIQGIRDAAGTNCPKIIIHIASGGDWNGTEWFFDNLTAQGVPFDIIGQSYYPFWNGDWSGLHDCLSNAIVRYHKPVLVAETAFPWTDSAGLYGIPASPEGQVQYVATLAQILRNLPSGMGAGVLWWGAEFEEVPGADGGNFGDDSFFDGNGNVLPVADAFGSLVAPLQLNLNLTNNHCVQVTWPFSGAAMSLTSSRDLSAPAPWIIVTNAVDNAGPRFESILPIESGQSRFYRLQSR